ncbi:hypothetical protein DICA1_C04984 [Diutina catenulata]
MALPEPPYYSVVFTSTTTADIDAQHYKNFSTIMMFLAKSMPGFLGVDSARDDKLGITVSYWQDLESIRQWKQQGDHKLAQEAGKAEFYKSYTVRVAKVERQYSFEK